MANDYQNSESNESSIDNMYDNYNQYFLYNQQIFLMICYTHFCPIWSGFFFSRNEFAKKYTDCNYLTYKLN